RFLREARSVAQLRHPSIVPVHEAGQANGVPYLVSEFVEGVTLADQLTALRPAPREAAQLIAAVADALQYAHDRGVVHRDVKPSNIMLEVVRGNDGSAPADVPRATHHAPKLMDFGLARPDEGEATATPAGRAAGPLASTPHHR